MIKSYTFMQLVSIQQLAECCCYGDWTTVGTTEGL